MKKAKRDLITKLKSILTTSILVTPFCIVATTFATQVSINGSPGLDVNTDVIYNYTTNPREVNFQIADPIVCSSLFDSPTPIIVDIMDPNNSSVSGVNGLLSVKYIAKTKILKFTTDFSVKCASAYGLHQESIYTQGFEISQNDVEILMLDSNEQLFPNNLPVADMQIVNYYYIVRNNGSTTTTVDVLENYLTVQSSPHFIDIAGDDWTCSTNGGVTTTCGDVSSGDGFVSLTNAVLEPGDELEINVVREVDVPNGTLGATFDLLATVFNKTYLDTVTLNNIETRRFGSVSNAPPTINFTSIPAFSEGGSSNVINFTVSDLNMDDSLIVVTATSSDTSIIPNSPTNIIIGGSGTNRTIQVIPTTNANTQVNPVTITIQADDGINPTTKPVSVTITPVNDAPSFSFSCTDNIVDSQTGLISCNNGASNKAFNIASFITGIDYGNSFDDVAQSVSEYIISSVNDPDGIIHSDGGGYSVSIDAMTNKLTFSLDGNNYGTAIIGVKLKDTGGLPGVDTSLEKQFTLTVPIPTYTFTATVSGLPAQEFLGLRVLPAVGVELVSSTQVDGQLIVGTLELGSDYTISINTQTPGAGCSIDGSVNGEIVGTNLADHVNFSVSCGAP
jgi:hypothetical protein